MNKRKPGRLGHDQSAVPKKRGGAVHQNRIRRIRGWRKEFAESDEIWWWPDKQNKRLSELTSQEINVKEEPLRRDIRKLGALLGNELKEQICCITWNLHRSPQHWLIQIETSSLAT